PLRLLLSRPDAVMTSMRKENAARSRRPIVPPYFFRFLVGPVIRACLRRGLTSEVNARNVVLRFVGVNGFQATRCLPVVSCRVHTIPLASRRASGYCSCRGHREASHEVRRRIATFNICRVLVEAPR